MGKITIVAAYYKAASWAHKTGVCTVAVAPITTTTTLSPILWRKGARREHVHRAELNHRIVCVSQFQLHAEASTPPPPI